MIHVKLLGGAKKSLGQERLSIENNDLTIQKLLEQLQRNKPKNTPKLDVNNLLIAVNGIDSSAINGKNTKLNNNDVVSIIPIIHGGSSRRTQFQISNLSTELIEIKSRGLDVDFLTKLRKQFPKLIIQGIDARFILCKSHAIKILQISLEAKKNQNLLSKKLETDILMRFVCTTQISEAIETAGIKPGKNFIIIALGNKLTLNKLFSELKPYLNSKTFSTNNYTFLKKQFNFSKKQINSITSSSPVEDLLAEKAAVLF